MIESITPRNYGLLFALAIPVEKGNLGPRHRGAGETIGSPQIHWGPPLTDDQKPLLEGGLPSKRFHWCMPRLCVAMIHFTDYQSFLQLCLLTFDQRFPFNTRKICLERKRERKPITRKINGSWDSGGLWLTARGTWV